MRSATADRQALLESLAFTAARLCAGEFRAFTDRLRHALSQPASCESGSRLRRMAGNCLAQSAPVLKTLMHDCLLQSLLTAVREAVVPEQDRNSKEGPHQSLVVQLGAVLDQAHADRLVILGMRISRCGPDGRRALAHPFRAEIFVGAFADAWTRLENGKECLSTVLEVLGPRVFLRLDMVYDALNSDLAAHAVLPDAEQRYWDDVPELTLVAAPSDMQQWLSTGGDSDLFRARAGVLLDGTFDNLAREARLASPLHEAWTRIASRLRPALQQDKTFFLEGDHPARRLLQAVLTAGLACGHEADMPDPLFAAVAGIPDRLRVQGDAPAMDVLADEVGRLTAQRIEAESSLPAALIAEAFRQERDEESQRKADEQVASRLETGEVSDFMEVFLQEQWTRVLATAWRHSEKRPGLPARVLAAMDTLIWSVRPKAEAAERRQLLEGLPSLLSMLNAWLDVIQWHGKERERFFTELAAQHLSAVRGPQAMSARARLGVRMAVVEKASVYQLDRREKQQQQASHAPFLQQVDGLQAGQWMELVRNDGAGVICRIAWISPGRSRFLLATARKRHVFPLSRDALAQALSVQRARLLLTETWVDRAMAAALEAATRIGVD